uniref:5-formyltetrahydrofolate cyclo-ligase n=1 Tax=Culicoides sonorensis TaxID=179676 RepID=A0A336M8Y0_CULSO
MSQNPVKKVLRDKIKSIINGMTKEERDSQSSRIAQKIFNLPKYKIAQRVSVYFSTDKEVDTMPIIKDLFKNGKQVFVPTYKKNVMEMVQLYNLDDYNALPVTKWNIKQPNIDDNRMNCMECGLDLIILPGVAFTRNGNRLGHGMGYYDKFLTRYFEKHPKVHQSPDVTEPGTMLIGISFKQQIVDIDELPMEAHDYKLDLVVTSD